MDILRVTTSVLFAIILFFGMLVLARYTYVYFNRPKLHPDLRRWKKPLLGTGIVLAGLFGLFLVAVGIGYTMYPWEMKTFIYEHFTFYRYLYY